VFIITHILTKLHQFLFSSFSANAPTYTRTGQNNAVLRRFAGSHG